MSKDSVPSYRRQRDRRGSDLAFVVLNDRRVYLGEYDSEESRGEYDRLLAEWLARARQPLVSPDEITIIELVHRYWNYAEHYYGSSSRELANMGRALAPVKALYGKTTVSQFGPKSIKAVREKFVARGLCRQSVNNVVERIRRMFRWGVAEELVLTCPHERYHRLC